MMHKPIFLIGYMGCGKSTLGRALGRALGRQFIDLDYYIESRFHTTVAALFADRGEEGFRRLEHAMLHEVAEMQDVVIACGGGTPCYADNIDYMNRCGTTFRLVASDDVLVRRMLRSGGRRPLVGDKSEAEIRADMAVRMAEREPFYAKAHHSFESEELENARQIDRAVALFLQLYNSEITK